MWSAKRGSGRHGILCRWNAVVSVLEHSHDSGSGRYFLVYNIARSVILYNRYAASYDTVFLTTTEKTQAMRETRQLRLCADNVNKLHDVYNSMDCMREC